MVEIGKYNKLKIVKDLDFGVYLDGGDGLEILLPARYVPKNVKPGDIILLHDYGTENTIIALDTILSTLSQKGYKFVTVSELLDKNNR